MDDPNTPPMTPSAESSVIVEYDKHSGLPEVRLSADTWDYLHRLGEQITATKMSAYTGDVYERLWPGALWPSEVSDIVMAALAAEHAMVDAEKNLGAPTSPDRTMLAIEWYARLVDLATDKMAELAREGRRAAIRAQAPKP